MKAEPRLVRVGLGFFRALTDVPKITARSNIEHRQGFDNHTVSAKVRSAF